MTAAALGAPAGEIDALLGQYRSGERFPVEVVADHLDRIEETDASLHAYVSVLRPEALAQARAAEELLRGGAELPPLLGVPVSIKDTFHVRGAVSALGSRVHAEAVAKTDSGVVARLREAGAVFLGKTVTAEFAQSASVRTRLGPSTRNPRDPSRTTGGSSGGAAASVAADLAMVGIGSDGGGSIRMPAAFTGVVGVKPTRDLCRDEHGFRGMSPFSSPGPLTRTVADAVRVLGVLADRPLAPAPERALRVAYCPDLGGRPAEPAVLAAVDRAARLLAGRGHLVERAEVPVEGWEEIFGILVLEEEHRERGHLLDRYADELTDYERKSLERAARLTPEAVEDARARRRALRAGFAELLARHRYDVVLTPTVAVPAFALDTVVEQVAGRPVDRLWGAYPFTAPFNVADACAASLPCGLADGLPVGAQLAAGNGSDETLLRACHELELALAGAGIQSRP